ncbi:MAG: hypothetical protein HRF50_15100 [Phycisphaerae bacterium]|jgi:hypothetical protein
MSLRLVKPRPGGDAFRPLPEGWCSVSKVGVLLAYTSDLELVQVDSRAVLLADGATLRIGIRRPDDEEAEYAVSVRPVRRGAGKLDRKRREVNVLPAIRELGLTPAAAAGRYELRTKDNTLLIELTGAAQHAGEAVDASRPKQTRE